MIAANSQVLDRRPQVQPQKSAQTDELVESIERMNAAKVEQKRLEAQARKQKKVVDTITAALSDTCEKHGGTIEVGPYVLGFDWKAGTPSYKAICEELIAEFDLPPETLLEKTADTPPRRVLVVA